MALTTITSRVDSKDKVEFDSFCKDVGINTSIAINMFIKAVLREGKIPFSIGCEKPNNITMEAIKETEEIEKNINEYKRYKDVEELMEDLMK